MKTAVSIPNPIFEAAEELTSRLGISRSQLYAKAVERFVDDYRQKNVTEALDRVYGEEPAELGPGLVALQATSLPADEW